MDIAEVSDQLFDPPLRTARHRGIERGAGDHIAETPALDLEALDVLIDRKRLWLGTDSGGVGLLRAAHKAAAGVSAPHSRADPRPHRCMTVSLA